MLKLTRRDRDTIMILSLVIAAYLYFALQDVLAAFALIIIAYIITR